MLCIHIHTIIWYGPNYTFTFHFYDTYWCTIGIHCLQFKNLILIFEFLLSLLKIHDDYLGKIEFAMQVSVWNKKQSHFEKYILADNYVVVVSIL